MAQDSKTIELSKLPTQSRSEIASMLRDLEGDAPQEPGMEQALPTRFISAGGKGAPPRWPTRFITDIKNAPKRD